MKSRALLVLPEFLESASSLSKETQSKLLRILKLLSSDVRHPGLQSKKLKGSKADLYECRVDRNVRLIYDAAPGSLRCWYVGAHDRALSFEPHPVEGLPVDDIEIRERSAAVSIAQIYLTTGEVPVFQAASLTSFDQRSRIAGGMPQLGMGAKKRGKG